MRVAIYTRDGERGVVVYDSSTKDVMVSHPNRRVRNAVRHYLTSEKDFTIPMSRGAVLEHGIMVYEKPTRDKSFMEMGLCEMFHSIGVHVDWGDPDNRGGSMEDMNFEDDPNAVIKSMDDFDFIN